MVRRLDRLIVSCEMMRERGRGWRGVTTDQTYLCGELELVGPPGEILQLRLKSAEAIV